MLNVAPLSGRDGAGAPSLPKQLTSHPFFAFSSTNVPRFAQIIAVRTCIIFNPTAKGNKARHFRRHLDEFAANCTLKLTAAMGDARKLATESVEEGFEI